MWMYLLIMNWNCIIALISIGQVYSQEITCIWNGRLSLNGTYNDSYTRLDTFWEHDGSLIMAKDSAGTITIIDSTYIGRLSEWDRYNAGMLLYNVTDSDAGAYVTRVTFSGGVASYRYSVAVSVVPETEKTVKEAIDKFGYYLIDDQQYDLTEKNSGKTPRNISLTIDLEDANIPPVGIELIIDEEPKACNQPLGYSCSESVDAGKTVVIQIKWQSEEFQYPVYEVATTTAYLSTTQTPDSSTTGSPPGEADNITQSTTDGTDTTDPTDATDLPKPPRNGLEPWHYALIGVGCLVILIIIVIIAWCCCKQHRNRQPQDINDPHMTNGYRNGMAHPEQNTYVNDSSKVTPVVFSAKDPSKSVYTPSSQAYSNPGYTEPPIDYNEGGITQVNVGGRY